VSKKRFSSTWGQALSGVSIFLVVLLWYGQLIAVSPGPVLGGNEYSHAKTLDMLAHRGQFNFHPRGTDNSLVNGLYYSNKPPGFPVTALPGYVFLEFLNDGRVLNPYLFGRGFNAFCTALIAVLLFNYLQRKGVSERAALFGVLAATF